MNDTVDTVYRPLFAIVEALEAAIRAHPPPATSVAIPRSRTGVLLEYLPGVLTRTHKRDVFMFRNAMENSIVVGVKCPVHKEHRITVGEEDLEWTPTLGDSVDRIVDAVLALPLCEDTTTPRRKRGDSK